MLNNVRGYKSKENVIKRIVSEEEPVLLALVETKLEACDTVELPGYQIVRTDRENEGGGVLIAFRSCLKNTAVIVREYKEHNCEMSWLRLNSSQIKIKLGVIYMPQESRTSLNTLKEIYEVIEEEVRDSKAKEESIILLGDFNCKIGNYIPKNKEEITKAGKLMLKMIKRQGLKTVNGQECCEGTWTRKEGNNKSIIDYVIVFEEDLNLVQKMVIDEDQNKTPYYVQTQTSFNRVFTDHFMITTTLNLSLKNNKKPTYCYVLNKEGMLEFKDKLLENRVSEIIDENDIKATYTKWNSKIIELRDSCYKKVKLNRQWKVCRRLTSMKKDITKQLKRTTNKLDINKLKQRRLLIMQQIEDEERKKHYEHVNKTIAEVKKDGGVNSATFWKVRKKLSAKNDENAHAVLDKNGKKCEKPEEIKQVYTDWYKELLSTKVAETEIEKQAEEIVRLAMVSMEAMAQNKSPQETSYEEVATITKKLNTKKAKDLQTWKNDIIKNGGDEMIKSIVNISNQVDKQRQIPDEWEQMQIRSIHKKGNKMEMSNKRGLFLTNNISKVYERIVKQRNDIKFRDGITAWQNGGIKNRSPTDNIFIVTSVIEQNKYLNRQTYLTLTDAEKCFDKLWLDDGIFELWRCGTDIRDCMIIRKLNKSAKIIIKTPVGDTEVLQVNNIVRQGSVYGVQICIAEMDRVNLSGKDIVTSYSAELDIGAPTFVDDVMSVGGIIVANNLLQNCNIQEERKKMTFSTKNGKTEYMVINSNKTKQPAKVVTSQVKNGMVKQVKEHKPLGTWFNEEGTYSINNHKNMEKLSYMIKTTKVQASPNNLGILAVEGRLKLIEAVVIQSILYNTDAFPIFTKSEIKNLEQMQHKILTEVLEVPGTTPYIPLLLETGFWTMSARLAYKKLMLYHNFIRSDEKRIAKQLINQQKIQNRKSTWYSSVQREIQKYCITINPELSLKSKWKKHVKERINNTVTKELQKECKTKTKGRFVKNDDLKLKQYLKELPLSESKNILRTRLNMIKVPANFKGNSIDSCPLCTSKECGTEHYFQCKKVKLIRDVWGVQEANLYSNDVKTMRNVSLFLEDVEIMIGPVLKRI